MPKLKLNITGSITCNNCHHTYLPVDLTEEIDTTRYGCRNDEMIQIKTIRCNHCNKVLIQTKCKGE